MDGGVDDDVESSPSSRIDDRLLRALPPTDIIQDEQILSIGATFGVAVNAAAVAASNNNEDGDDDDGGGGPNEEETEEPIFETSFDLTPERLRYVFDTFDTDTDGKIDYDSLKRGLKEWQHQAGMRVSALEGRTFTTLVSFLDSDDSGDITFEEFAEGFRLLMLRALIPAAAATATGRREEEGAPLEVLDYDATRLEQNMVGEEGPGSSASSKLTRTDDFFFKRREDWVKTRWVNVLTAGEAEKSIALTLRRLAVKYLLHPLALEDALEPDTHRPKVEVFPSHYFLIIPVFSLEKVDSPRCSPSSSGKKIVVEEDVQLPRRWHRRLWSCCKVKLGCPAKERFPSRRPPLSRVKVEMISIFVNVPHNDTIITCNQSGNGRGSSSSNASSFDCAQARLWQRVQRELDKPYSKLRQYDAQYLTYALLDQSVDLLVPIVKTMRRDIADERTYLRRTDFARGLRRVHELRTNLERVCRKIKPFVRVLTHVIEDDAICPGVTIYLRDVLDNLECSEDDLHNLIEQCDALSADADKYYDRQMNRTLYLLTIISAIFLPAQFLTGVWGMNFTDMPELQENWGYEMFWVITATMTIVLLLFFCIFGRLKSVEDY